MMPGALKALSDPTRLKIVEFLSHQCCARALVDETGGVISPTAGEVCCHITGAPKVSSTISHHLHELEAAQVVTLERRRKHTFCTLRSDTLTALAGQLEALARGETRNDCC